MNKKHRVLSLSPSRAKRKISRQRERYLVLHFQVDVFAFVFFLFFFVRHDDDVVVVVVMMFPSFSSRSDDFFFFFLVLSLVLGVAFETKILAFFCSL